MAKVYTTVPGARIEVGCYGYATSDVPAEVPDRVGRSLEEQPGLRVEFLPPATATDGDRAQYPRRNRVR
jgi:hypothetical protein